MLILAHKNLDVWKASMDLLKCVYNFTKELPSEEKYIFVSQMRRASLSVLSNLAEGIARISNKEKIRFIEISRSSLVELDTHFEACIQLDYTSYEDLKEEDELINKIFAMLTKLTKYYDK